MDTSFVICAFAVMAGALVQGTGGIGFAMVAAPVVAIVRPDLVPGPMILAGGVVSLLIAAREFSNIDYRGAALAIAGRIPGSIVAGLVIGLAPRSTFSLIFAVLILIAVLLSLTGWRVRATPTSLCAAGFASGVMGTLTSVGAPPMAIVMQNAAPPRLRATVGAFLAAGAMFSLAVLAWVGRFGWLEIKLGIALLIPIAIGFAFSTLLVRRISSGAVRPFVLGVCGVSALVLLARNA